MSVYKYLSANRLNVLHDATLRATQANALNDPFELRPFIEQIATGEDLDHAATLTVLTDRLVQTIYEGLTESQRKQITPAIIREKIESPEGAAKLASIRQETRQEILKALEANAERFRQVLHDKLGSSVGIISFSDVPDHVLMWSHYASEHRGFVIEFDDHHGFFDQRRFPEDDFLHLRQVFYVSPTPVYKSLKELDGNRLMCMKRAEWSHERERRMLIPVDSSNFSGDGDPIHLIQFPRATIKSVILGARTSDETKAAILNILGSTPEYTHVKVRSASIDARSGDVNVSK